MQAHDLLLLLQYLLLRIGDELCPCKAVGGPHFYLDNVFRCVHQTLRVTPAMEAGLTDHIWTIEELLAF